MPYKVVMGDNQDVRVDITGKKYSPPEISAMILGKLKQQSFHRRALDGGGDSHALHKVSGHIAEHPRSRFSVFLLFLWHAAQ